MDVLWTLIIFFAWVAWIWLLIVIFSDIFRRRDIGGWAKAAWIVFMIVVPFIGVLVYLIAQHDGMAERQAQQVETARQHTDEYIRSVATSDGGAADQIAKAKQLLDSGAITQEEFDSLKSRALAA
jgi:energy-coupling factor transporter transmembrane protein EcfT